ncbi:MAG: NADH-quinone oxidoreductase subunit NuoE [Candidatus Latescibacterota bacterium]|nr:NADH-quinone oxidoreductase subunit NuoE [Candidatus Latescibacterota bacterium]
MAVELTEETRQKCEAIIQRYPDDWKEAAILPVLHTVHKEWGYVSLDGLKLVADTLDMPPARAAGVMSFYPMFHKAPIGKHLIQVCATLSCSLCGAKNLVDHLKEKLQIDIGGTSADGMWTLEKAECIAACEGAPAIRIDEKLYRNVTPERLDKMMAGLD